MKQIIRIGTKTIGYDQPCFIIAEAGVNHNGDLKTAKKLIDCAAEAGADAVKFQTFKAAKLVTKDAKKADYQQRCTGSKTQYEMLKKLELSDQDFFLLSDYATKKGIIFLSTPFDCVSVDLLEKINVAAYKITSGDLTNYPFLEYVAVKKKPVILSTGMGTLSEVSDAISVLKNAGAEEIILLHCTTDYPAFFEEVNLRAIKTLECAFKLPTGFSDHTTGIIASVAAVAMGACLIEKHFTLDKASNGPDHKASLNPIELKELVSGIRNIEKAMGNGIKVPSENEEKIKIVARKSIVAKKNIKMGTIIDESMLDFKRPGIGLEPKYLQLLISKKTKIQIKKDTLLTWDMIS
jgi:N-acetylneuraminate synthase/N,N'-diacetyllegionaminate synthase